MNEHYVDPNLDSGRFSDLAELEADYTEIVYNSSENVNASAGLGIEIRQDAQGNVTGALIDGEDTNTIIVSSTGSGKTRRVLSQYILSCIFAEKPNSFVVHDPKAEIYGFFYNLLMQKGYNVKVLNLRDPMRGDRLNFLQEAAALWKAGKHGRALEIARGIAQIIYSPLENKDDMFWTQSSISLFLCYFTIAANLYSPDYVTLDTIYKTHIEGTEHVGSKTKMEIYLDSHKEDMCYGLGIPSVTAPNETKHSIYSVFTNGLVRLILNEEISDMLTKSTFKVEELVTEKRPMALFIITRDEAQQTYSSVVSTYVDTIYTALIDLSQTRYHSKLPRTVHFILEEFGNIKLENINDMMTASRSRGIRMVVVLQSLCQLYLTYTKELAHVLIGNSHNLVFMSSTDMELVNMISERCGTMVDPYTNERRLLLSPDRLTHLDKNRGETLMLLGRHHPYITCLPDLSSYKMIEPLDRIHIRSRRKLIIETGKFSAAVKDITDKRFEDMMQEHAAKAENQKKQAEMTRKEMTTFPPRLLKKMNEIIESI